MRIVLCEWKDLDDPSSDIDDPKWAWAWDEGYRAAKGAIAEQSVEVTAEELEDWYLGSSNLKSPRNWEDFLMDKLETKLENRRVMNKLVAQEFAGKEKRQCQ